MNTKEYIFYISQLKKILETVKLKFIQITAKLYG